MPLSLLVDMQCTAIVWNWPGCSCTLVFTVVKITRRLEAPTLEHLLRLSCGLHVGLDILIYFRKARDKHFLNSNELIAFFFKQYFKPYFFSNYLALTKQARRFLLKNSGRFFVPASMFPFLNGFNRCSIAGDRYGFLISFPYIINDRGHSPNGGHLPNWIY